MATVAWEQPATLIDLDGTTPLIAPLQACVRHFGMLKPAAQDDARILLTQPMPRLDRKTRTWVLGPDHIRMLAERLRAEHAGA